MGQAYDTRNPGDKDPYEILGVPRTATKIEIDHAFKDLAHIYHPDKIVISHKAGPEKFMEIKWAHDVLSDPEIRKAYDRYGLKIEPKYDSRTGGFFRYSGGFFNDVGGFF